MLSLNFSTSMVRWMHQISMQKPYKKTQVDSHPQIYNSTDKEIKYITGHSVWGQAMAEEVKIILPIKETLPEYSILETPKKILKLRTQLKRESSPPARLISSSEKETRNKCRKKKYWRNRTLLYYCLMSRLSAPSLEMLFSSQFWGCTPLQLLLLDDLSESSLTK